MPENQPGKNTGLAIPGNPETRYLYIDTGFRYRVGFHTGLAYVVEVLQAEEVTDPNTLELVELAVAEAHVREHNAQVTR